MNSHDSRTGGNILLSNLNIKSFIPLDLNNTNMNSIKQFPLKLLLIQCILTYYFTNTKRFSIQAYIMNLAWLYGIYFTYITKNIKFLLVPIILRAFFLVVNIVYGNIPKYITTDYLYGDFMENMNKNNKCNEYYTEGTYNGILPFNTLDKNAELEMNIQNWGLEMYNNAYNNPEKNIFNGKLMKKAQINKCKWIVENLGITSKSKVLEMGFGKMDLMKYIRDNTGATVEGMNLCMEQIKQARKEGFKCYHINFEDIGDNLDILDRYDVIITDGSLEYFINTSDNYDKFILFFDNIHKLLNSGGKWYNTMVHMSDYFKTKDRLAYNVIKKYIKNNNTFMNLYNVYYLQAGNEGGYPIGKDGLTKFADKKFDVVVQEDRTMDYLLSSINWMICQINKNRRDTLSQKIKTNINHFICFLVAPLYDASYICYTPSRNWRYQPWLWQFLRQSNGHRPVDLYWIIFQKKIIKF
tara:strand:- start:916 stop:2316 length:1401 start_codon:yes stop_codon:yes gene_type:complete